MPKKVALVIDPGVDGAFTLATALRAPNLEVLAVAAAGGAMPPEVATQQLYQLLELFDPPRLPRVGAALPTPISAESAPPWLGGSFAGIVPASRGLCNLHPADKVLADEVLRHKGEVTILLQGPHTALAVGGDRHPDMVRHLRSLFVVGGALQVPGNAGPVAEFTFYADPTSARQVLRSGVPITLLPLDVGCQAIFAPADIEQFLAGNTAVQITLRKLLPLGLRAMADGCGIEGLQLAGMVAVVLVAEPGLAKCRPITVDVETQGQLTRGMTVVDRRPRRSSPNVDCVYEVDWAGIRAFLQRIFRD
jgi:inosine-uridine nucleoside N-ribohydrolase